MPSRKYKKLPRTTKMVIEFHNGIHSFYTTKASIMERRVTPNREMSQSLIEALTKLEKDREEDCGTFGFAMTCNSVGRIKDSVYTLDIDAHRIKNGEPVYD